MNNLAGWIPLDEETPKQGQHVELATVHSGKFRYDILSVGGPWWKIFTPQYSGSTFVRPTHWRAVEETGEGEQ
jgi:hypothetical protein